MTARAAARAILPGLLFGLTALSTLRAGAEFSGSPAFDALRGSPAGFLAGAPFAATLLAILGVHELGHWLAARRHAVAVSLPYFLPAPPPLFLFGTLGAVIRLRAEVRERNALLDIAVAGPLAGLAVALPALVVGLGWSRVVPLPPGGHVAFGDSLLTLLLAAVLVGPMPPGAMLFTHPVADAAWVGCFVTALNLFPAGQLDGGRVARALVGSRVRRLAGGAILGALGLGVWTGSANWYAWAALMLAFGAWRRSPSDDDLAPLTRGRRRLGWATLGLLVILVPPMPLALVR